MTKPDPQPMSISNCQFSGVHFDAPAIEAVRVVAEGLLKNAEGLLTLARVLNASDVKIESLLKIEQPITAKRTLKLKDRSK